MVSRTLNLCAVVLLSLTVLTSVAAPAGAESRQAKAHKSRAGKLDRGFGKRGKHLSAPYYSTVGGGLNSSVWMAWGGGGRIVIAGNGTIERLTPDGLPDRSFGEGGSIHIVPPAGETFLLAAVAVDSQGRVLVAGDSSPDGELWDRWITLLRYLPNGDPDPSFGDEGRLSTTLGLPAADTFIDSPAASEAGVHRLATDVAVRGLTVDSQDRPILTGAHFVSMTSCYMAPKSRVYQSFVARLTSAGDLDPSFADGGVATPLADEGAQRPLLSKDGSITFVALQVNCVRATGSSAVQRLTGAGAIDTGFGSAGIAAASSWYIEPLSPEPNGGMVFLQSLESSQIATRLLRNGRPDLKFGTDGKIHLGHGPAWATETLLTGAVDARGRLLFAGAAHGGNPRRGLFLVERWNRTGKIDRRFNHRGRSVTGFGAHRDARARAILVGRGGRITVGGLVKDPAPGNGIRLAVTRYHDR